MPEVVGPLGRVLPVNKLGQGEPPRANALTILRRCAVRADGPNGPSTKLDESPLLSWATATQLGHDPELAEAVRRRRFAALRVLRASSAAPVDATRIVEVVVLAPESALLVGAGESGPRNVGLAQHGTYGWPVLRGSTLKGVTLAYAREVDDPDRVAIFGSSPEDPEHWPGAVAFLDAVWVDDPRDGVRVARHVLTPHVGEYYRDTTGSKPPAEWENPVPVEYLAVERGLFPAALVGPRRLTERAAELLRAAVDELGVGAKTAAGYGYLRARG